MQIRELGPGWLEIHAPAKLNLFLEVLGKTDDGFHRLETVMCRISLYDTIWFQHLPDTTQLHLEVVPALDDIPTDERNLLVRAMRLLQQAHGMTTGARLRLFKRIPSQAGLGGGSADAAAALLLANHAWDLGLTREGLLSHAANLGSDVSFFLGDSPSVCRGRGEQLQRYEGAIPRHWVVVKPSWGLETAAVYRQLKLGGDPPRDLPASLSAEQCFNRLQPPALELRPELKQTQRRLREVGLIPWMSGSGSAFFAACRGSGQALRAANALRQRGEHEVYVTQSLIEGSPPAWA
ncbi:MAG: 4-(cytidine 5'-diphospho)-2-C-methyl-D-erythritol kinase [Planctomycetota bacterium]